MNGNGNANSGAPLAWSAGGDPIELPATAVAWRVKRLPASAKGGAPEVVYGDGVPLVVPLATTAAEFAEAVEDAPGKYRLEALDEANKLVASVPPAYHVVKPRTGRRTAVVQGEAGDVAVSSLAAAFMNQNDAVAGMLSACAELMRELKTLVPSPNTWVPVMQAALPRPQPAAPSPRNARGENADDTDDEGGDDGEDQDDETAPEPTPMIKQVFEHLKDLGPENIMALGKAVPEMVGGLVREAKGAFGDASKGPGGGGGS